MKPTPLILAILCLALTANAACPEICKEKPEPFHVYILMYLPVVLFLFFLGVIGYWLASGKIKAKNLLMEKKRQAPVSPPVQAKDTQQQPQSNIPAVQVPVSPQPDDPDASSTSRMLLLLSGVVAIAISVCYFAFMVYSSSIGNGKLDGPNWGEMSVMLTSLGLGVIPYMTKQFFKQ